jgi:glutathione peroxidase-family protein
VLAFPCNQFGSQEQGTKEEIRAFALSQGALLDEGFDLFDKCNVNGNKALPAWQFLKSRLAGSFGSFIKWNFTKFLVDRNGIPIKRYGPKDPPLSMEVDIVHLLAEDSAAAATAAAATTATVPADAADEAADTKGSE